MFLPFLPDEFVEFFLLFEYKRPTSTFADELFFHLVPKSGFADDIFFLFEDNCDGSTTTSSSSKSKTLGGVYSSGFSCDT